MFANITNGCIVLVLVCQSTVAIAQNGNTEWPKRFYQPVVPLPPELGFGYHHASTALEGALRGQAEVIHATGNYSLSLSQALICREQARWLAQANQRQWVEYRIALWNWREWDRQRRIVEFRTKNEALRATRYDVYRLKPNQLDRTIGVIAWPEVLRAAEYDDLRGRLDELFRIEASGDGMYVASAAEVESYTRMLRDQVRRNRGSLTPADYLAAQKFLSGVKHEAEFPLVHPASTDRRTTANTQSADPSKTLTELN